MATIKEVYDYLQPALEQIERMQRVRSAAALPGQVGLREHRECRATAFERHARTVSWASRIVPASLI